MQSMNDRDSGSSAGQLRYLLYRRLSDDCADIAGEMMLLEHQLREAARLNRIAVVDDMQLKGIDARCVRKAPTQLIAMDKCRLHGPEQPAEGTSLRWVHREELGEIDERQTKIVGAGDNHSISQSDDAQSVFLVRDLSGFKISRLNSLRLFEEAELNRYRVRLPFIEDIETLAHDVIAELQGFETPNLTTIPGAVRPGSIAGWEKNGSHVWVDLRQTPNRRNDARKCLNKISEVVPQHCIPFYACLDGYDAQVAHKALDLLKKNYSVRTRADFSALQPYLDQERSNQCQPWIIDCVEFLIMSHACVKFHSQPSMRRDFSLLYIEAYHPKWRILYLKIHNRINRILRKIGLDKILGS